LDDIVYKVQMLYVVGCLSHRYMLVLIFKPTIIYYWPQLSQGYSIY